MDDAWMRYAHLSNLAHQASLAAMDALGTDAFQRLLDDYHRALEAASRVRLEIRQAAHRRTKVVQEITGRHGLLRDRAG